MKFNFKQILKSLSVLILLIVIISCDKEISRSPVEPEPINGNLKVFSNPNGFLIYLNGRNSGSITPDSLLFLDSGNYQVTLKKKYFRDSTFSISLAEDQKINLEIDFTQNPAMRGKLNITSIPVGANIILNDSSLGLTTPQNIQALMPGEYDVKISFPQHRTASAISTVTSGTTSYFTKALVDTSVWVDYQVGNSGLVSNNLSCVAIDKNGHKWIGSFDKGLMKFDGTNFTVFNKNNSGLPNDRVLSISVDSQNKIWVGTNDGLGIYDGSSWIVYNKNNSGLRSNEILSFKFDNSITWIGAYTGLYRFDGTNWTRYNDSQLSIWVNDLEIDNGDVWLATTSGIARLKNETLEYFIDTTYLYPTKIISAVEKDELGNIWFCHLNSDGKRNGVSYFNGSTFTNFYFGTALNAMNSLFIDSENNKWISTNEGLVRLNSNNDVTISNKSNSLITSDKVSNSAIDQNGVLWITTYFNGLNKFKFNSK
ncbi:MAG: PEGA domain-containing protein [Ignavibacteriaceae bacterium]